MGCLFLFLWPCTCRQINQLVITFPGDALPAAQPKHRSTKGTIVSARQSLHVTITTNYNHFMALWILSGTTWVSRYQKKNSLQIIVLGDKGTRVWKTCLSLLTENETAKSWTWDLKSHKSNTLTITSAGHTILHYTQLAAVYTAWSLSTYATVCQQLA